MKKAFLFVVLCVLSSPVQAEDSLASFLGRAVGNDNVLKLEMGFRPGTGEDRVEAGLYGEANDGMDDSDKRGVGAGFYGQYDLVKDAPFKVLSFEVPVTWSAGASLGFLKGQTASWDITSSLFTGVTFGIQKTAKYQIELGARGQYNLTKNLWKEFADLPDEAAVLASIGFRYR
jgi:hypothetical protein